MAEVDRSRLSGAVTQTRAFTIRSLREVTRNRTALAWSLALPAFWFLVLAGTGDETGPKIAMAAIAFGTFGAFAITLGRVGGMLARDVRQRRYRKLRSLPIAPLSDLTGRFLAGFLWGVTSFVLVLGVSLGFGATYSFETAVSPVVVLVALFLFCLVGMAVSVALLRFADTVEDLSTLRRAAVLGLFVGTGFNGISPDWLPPVTRGLVNVIPNALATRLIAHHMVALPTASTPPLPAEPRYLALLGVYALVFVVLAGYVMDRTVYRGEAGE